MFPLLSSIVQDIDETCKGLLESDSLDLESKCLIYSILYFMRRFEESHYNYSDVLFYYLTGFVDSCTKDQRFNKLGGLLELLENFHFTNDLE
ncbi:ghmp kinase [Entamoeba histolytica]|uniref:Ghmp kinase n=1 Tax=Entamoeba histolytica TaxID=5759 RepID=A0A175K012_ENTHI|nr:ghmp kinase [Entamoeba histolytica]